MIIQYQESDSFTEEEVVTLYESVGWHNYLKDSQKTLEAIQHSYAISARVEGELVGLVRGVTDHRTILYIQDILVLPNCQRQGIGQAFIDKLLKTFSDVGQIVLLTDDTEKMTKFYESCGFSTAETYHCVTFIQDNRN